MIYAQGLAISGLALLVLSISCGSETKTSSDKSGSDSPVNRENGMTFKDDANLPACDDTREGVLAYVTSTANFRTCSAGTWTVIELKGEKGDKGDSGTGGIAGKDAGDTNIAINLYKKYKYSIFRVELNCKKQVGAPSSCDSKPPTVGFFGSAFLCGDKSVCTNGHVVSCQTCYEMDSLGLQAVEGASDSVNSDGTPATPFFTMSSNATIKLHLTEDLARFPIPANPPNAIPLTLSSKVAKGSVTPLQPMLSISFPLGFQDLYVDVGNVNTPVLGQCNNADKYECPSDYYDFSTTNDTDHGSSGSPLLDIATGEVVGVTSAGTEGENANYTWAIDASFLTTLE